MFIPDCPIFADQTDPESPQVGREGTAGRPGGAAGATGTVAQDPSATWRRTRRRRGAGPVGGVALRHGAAGQGGYASPARTRASSRSWQPRTATIRPFRTVTVVRVA